MSGIKEQQKKQVESDFVHSIQDPNELDRKIKKATIKNHTNTAYLTSLCNILSKGFQQLLWKLDAGSQ